MRRAPSPLVLLGPAAPPVSAPRTLRRTVSRVLLALSVAAAAACGGTEPPAASSPRSVATPAHAKPRCSAGEASQPSDASTKMIGLQTELRQCFSLGTAGTPTSTLALEVLVAESGDVKAVKVKAEGAQPSAKECSEKVVRGTRFAKFCGDDVGISWVYTMQ